MNALKLTVGRCYRAKKPRQTTGFPGFVNDRQITWIGSCSVQYDGPGVSNGSHYPTVSKDDFLAWAARDITDELPKGEWQTWPIPKPEKIRPLTKSQIYTLRRLASGTKYLMSGDGKYGNERRQDVGKHGFRDVKAPSLPVLMREGYIAFKETESNREHSRYYLVSLTDKGREAAATMKIEGEQ